MIPLRIVLSLGIVLSVSCTIGCRPKIKFKPQTRRATVPKPQVRPGTRTNPQQFTPEVRQRTRAQTRGEKWTEGAVNQAVGPDEKEERNSNP